MCNHQAFGMVDEMPYQFRRTDSRQLGQKGALVGLRLMTTLWGGI